MARVMTFAIFVLYLFLPSSVLAQAQPDNQSQNFQDHVITVSRGGKSYAKPDLGILAMTIQSTALIAEEAVEENGRKARAVEAGLAQLGFTPQGFKITSVTFGQAGGPRFGPMQPQITAYEATQSVYVFFEAPDLKDVAMLTEKAAAVIEALRKAGATPSSIGAPGFLGGQSLITYTIKDPVEFEKQALHQAIDRARDAAQDMATETGVQLAGLRNVRSGFLYGNVAPRASQPNSLGGLTYRWYSSKSDEIEIDANATVDYNFK